MSQMMPPGPGGPQDGPSPAAAGAAQAGAYPTDSDPAMKPLGVAAQAIQAFIGLEPDPQLKAQGSKLLAMCHQILAGGEKQHDAALGLSPALKFIQRKQAMQGGGGAPGPAPDGGQGGY